MTSDKDAAERFANENHPSGNAELVADCKVMIRASFEAGAAHVRKELSLKSKNSDTSAEHVAGGDKERAVEALVEAIKDVIRNSRDIIAKKRCSEALAKWEAQK